MCKSKEKTFNVEFIIKTLNMIKDEIDVYSYYMPEFDGKTKYEAGANMAKRKIDKHIKTFKNTYKELFDEDIDINLRDGPKPKFDR